MDVPDTSHRPSDVATSTPPPTDEPVATMLPITAGQDPADDTGLPSLSNAEPSSSTLDAGASPPSSKDLLPVAHTSTESDSQEPPKPISALGLEEPAAHHRAVGPAADASGSAETQVDSISADVPYLQPSLAPPTPVATSLLSSSRPIQLPTQPGAPASLEPPGRQTQAPDLPSDALPVDSEQPSEPIGDEADLKWPLKTIHWPPLPTEAQPRRQVQIILQNENGPCSLLALCNILLLSGQITIQPPTRRTVSYDILSRIVADHMLRTAPKSPMLDLASALSILPRTRFGLDLNVGFTSTTDFKPQIGPDGGGGELSLFQLAGVPLLHGWLADPQDEETWLVVAKYGDYDTAVTQLAQTDEMARGLIVGEGMDTNEVDLERALEARHTWTPAQETQARDAIVLRNFLDTTASQLSYTGLFELGSTLKPDSLAALFRASHLGVLYRRPDAPDASYSMPEASLFQLVTDSTFQHESTIVWESLEDVDGSGSTFYGDDLRPSRFEGDFVSRGRRPSTGGSRASQNLPGLDLAAIALEGDPDRTLAAQLQQEEYEAEARARDNDHEHAARLQEDERRAAVAERDRERNSRGQRRSAAAPPDPGTWHDSAGRFHRAPDGPANVGRYTDTSHVHARPINGSSSQQGERKKKSDKCCVM